MAVSLVLLWHMHQPLYRLAGERVCFQPWVRLHGVRAYYDMVRLLEEFPGVKVTFNLVPVLLDQIRSYEGGASDAFREAACIPAEDLDDARRRFLVRHFFSAQEERLIRPLPRYAELLALCASARARHGEAEAWRDFTVADLRDLQALLDLAWLGFKAEEEFPEIRELRGKGRGYTQADIAALHRIEDTILRRLVPLYRQAAARGQAEISASPYAHPILPLLIDSDCAREATPEAALPPRFQAAEDARRQIAEAIERIGSELGAAPRGLWPSEGSVSDAAVALMERCGVGWAASDAEVLRASRRDGDDDPYRPWRRSGEGGTVDLVFRDHDLSDRIGFTYARSDPKEAAAEILAEARRRAPDDGLVLVALDGENPWEHYPGGGAAFLRSLYGALEDGGPVVSRTVSEAIAACPRRGTLRGLRAGSWIHADLGVWIGGPEKNRAWGLLGEVRRCLAGSLDDPHRQDAGRDSAWRSLRAAEGSDWFWWLDGQFDSRYREDFDRLLRSHLREACEALRVPPPEALGRPILVGRSVPASRPAGPAPRVEVVVDGYESSYYEWCAARALEPGGAGEEAAMRRARLPIESLRWGVAPGGEFCLRLDPDRRAGPGVLAGLAVELRFASAESGAREVSVSLDERGDVIDAKPASVRARARKILEMTVPAADAGLVPGRPATLSVRVRVAGVVCDLGSIDLGEAAGEADA
jgi:alpha-amylase/alpha-mannosidase (GH57 family)